MINLWYDALLSNVAQGMKLFDKAGFPRKELGSTQQYSITYLSHTCIMQAWASTAGGRGRGPPGFSYMVQI